MYHHAVSAERVQRMMNGELRVLLIEDESPHAELVRRAFDQRGGVELRVVQSLEEGRVAAAASPPDLIIADYLLPDGKGTDLLPLDGTEPPTPLVIMTSHGDEQLAVEALKRGAIDYIVKSEDVLSKLPQIAERAMREWEHVVQRRIAENALYQSEQRFRALYDDTPSMFFTLDREGTILSANAFGANYLGYEVDDLCWTSFLALYPEDQHAHVRRNLEAALVDDDVRRWEACKITKNGTLVWVRVTTRPVAGAEGAILLVVCEDVSEVHTLSEELSYQSTHDTLTRLLNWKEFERRLASVLRRTRNEALESALCFLDLDRFRVINDSCGHRAGDELLRQIAMLLQQYVRSGDTLARMGGDEFALLMEGCSIDDARKVAAKLHESIEQFRFVWEGQTMSIAVTIGVVAIDASSGTVEEVISAADSACYTAKKEGRNRYKVYREDDAVIARHQGEIQWVGRIQRALEERRFVLYYQPILPVSSDSRHRSHGEILLRMMGEDGRVILPGVFLPAAERYHLIARIDQWVVREALRWLGDHPVLLESSEFWAINLSGQSLGSPGMLEFILEQMDASGVPAEKLCFEVTETSAIANFSRAGNFIEKLRERGCRFALDDFGTGLSSLAYLKILPVDLIKIDGMFIRDVARDDVDAVSVRSIAEIAHASGKLTVAEFVETEEIDGKLRDLGIDFAQGFYHGKPRPLADLAALAGQSDAPPEVDALDRTK
jgi:diguanylate cyclase (GGDEF)-like protein/PAS domain S-box-containing protein